MAKLSKPITFMAAMRKGAQKQIEAYPFNVTVGNVKHRFALHQVSDGGWRVSCPTTGRKIIDLVAYMNGLSMHSRCLSAGQAMATCRAQVQSFTAYVGGDDAFNRVVLQALAQAEGVQTC